MNHVVYGLDGMRKECHAFFTQKLYILWIDEFLGNGSKWILGISAVEDYRISDCTSYGACRNSGRISA